MTRRRLLVMTGLLVAAVIGPRPSAAQTAYEVQPIPLNHTSFSVGTVNDDGDAAGQVYTGTGYQAFAWVNGTLTTISLGGTDGYGLDVNESGVVVGYSYITGNSRYRAFLFDGAVHDLGAFSVNGYSYARAINNAGVVVGFSDNQAFRYQSGVMQRLLDLLPAGSGFNQVYEAMDVNDAGAILARGNHNTLGFRNFVWTPPTGASPAKVTIIGDSNTSAQWINANGQVAGYQGVSGQTRSFLFTPNAGSGTFSVILGFGGTFAYPAGLNDNGEVAGYAGLPDGTYHTFLHTGGQTVDLGTTAGYQYSSANGVSNTGTIIGYSAWPFVWENGQFANLTDLINACGWSGQNVLRISRNGTIAAAAYGPNGYRPIVLRAAEEAPTTLVADNASAPHARPVTLRARLVAACSGIAGKSVSFALNASDRGSVVTGADGYANLATNVGPITVGTYANGVSAVFAGDDDYEPASDTAQLNVFKATPILTWTPAALVEGTPIGAAQLNATSDTPGTFSYSPGAGATLTAGLNNLFTSFAPSDTTNYNFTSTSALLAVRASNPTSTFTSAGAFTGLGGTSMDVRAFNNSGQAVGYASLPNNTSHHAFLFSAGTTIDLGTLGGTYSEARDVNDDGQIVGWAYTPFNQRQHAFLYSNGVMQDINPGTSPWSYATAISSNGKVGLNARGSSGYDRAFLYSNGSATELGTLAAGTYSYAQDVNASGQVVGYSYVGNCYHAFLATTAGMQDLGTLGGQCSQAQAINDGGHVIGWAQNAAGQQRAFLYKNGVMTDIGTLGGSFATANAISETGVITGWSYTANNQLRAFRYENGAMTDLGAIQYQSQGYDVNDSGAVVGYTYSMQGYQTAFLHDGTMRDVNSLVNVGQTVGLQEARFINNSGQIVARGNSGNTTRWYILDPSAAPAASAIAIDNATGVYNSPVTLTATLDIASPGGQYVRFTVNGSFVGAAITDANGVATLQNVSLGGLNAGTYVTTARFPGNEAYGGSTATGSLELGKAQATVTLLNMTRTYNGSPQSPSVSTAPFGFSVTFTGAPQTNAGSYEVTATVNHPNYEGSATGTFVINKATASVFLGSLTQTYTGSPLMPTASTSPGGLPVDWEGAPQTNAGSYTVKATVNHQNYTGTATSTFTIAKRTATVTLADLSQVYTGSPLSPTAATNPAGLTVSFGNAPQTNAGTYAVTATIQDDNYQGSANGSFVIAKAPATVTLAQLTQTYSGSPLTPGFSTSPGGLTVTWTNAPQTNAGTYQVTATINAANYQGSASGSFVIEKAVAAVTLANMDQTYTGNPLSPTATTAPSNLPVVWTGAPQTNAGDYQVTATINHQNYQGAASGTFRIRKAQATVTLANMTQTYTGSALSPTASTSPAGLALDWTGTPQVNAGSYPVSATVNHPNYEGSAGGSFVIEKALAAIALDGLTQTYTGSALSPTATTNPAGLQVVFTNAPQTNAGTYAVEAGIVDANYRGSTTASFVIEKAAATVTLGGLVRTYTGAALTPTATTSPLGLAVAWVGAPQTNAGSYEVTGLIDDPNYEGSATGTFVIEKAAATVVLANLTRTFTGGPLSPSATTAPAGLALVWTGTPQTNAGTYAVTATVNDPNYEGSANGSFVIAKATATVTLGAMTQTFTGGALSPTAATAPAGLALVWTGTPQTNAGTYAVAATVNDPNYEGSASGSFVIAKAAATVTLADLAQDYTGAALSPSATTSPAGLTIVWTNAPQTNPGSYQVTATVQEQNYQGAATGTFVISHTWSNVLQPVNADGTSIFKQGSTVPVKFRLTGASAPVTDLVARIFVQQVGSGITGTEVEATSTSAADGGNVFRYDAAAGQYIFNLSTKGMAQGTWQIRIDLGDGVLRTVLISLRR